MTWVRENRPTAAALVLGAGITLFVTLVPFVRFAYDNPALHLALETGEGLIAALLSYLAAKRFRATGRLQHLALAWAFAVLATVNLLLSAVPIVSLGTRPAGALTWAAAGFRLVAASALCLAAFAGARPAPEGRRLLGLVGAGSLAVVVTVALAASAADAWLADAIDPALSPESSTRPLVVAHPVVLAIQLLGLVLYGATAAGFTRQARKEPDELLRWLGGGALLGAFARVHYFLFPSLYSNWVYTGDLLRLGSYLFFLVGATREIDAYWRDQTRLAAVEERRRLARELHDGLTQELAFIRSQTAAMAAGMVLPDMVGHVAAAAERALGESRRAIDALADDPEGPLAEALRRAAEEVAARAGATVEVEAEPVPAVPEPVAQALVRVVREAATNAVRHGEARRLAVRLARDGAMVRMEVTDDGRGFDSGGVVRGFGLRSMRERVEGLGGELRISSQEGQGSAVEVVLPLRRLHLPRGVPRPRRPAGSPPLT